MSQQIVDLITAYDQSLTRMDSENDLQKKIIENAYGVHNIDRVAFQVVATAYHSGKMQELLDFFCSIKSVLEEVMNDERLAL